MKTTICTKLSTTGFFSRKVGIIFEKMWKLSLKELEETAL